MTPKASRFWPGVKTELARPAWPFDGGNELATSCRDRPFTAGNSAAVGRSAPLSSERACFAAPWRDSGVPSLLDPQAATVAANRQAAAVIGSSRVGTGPETRKPRSAEP